MGQAGQMRPVILTRTALTTGAILLAATACSDNGEARSASSTASPTSSPTSLPATSTPAPTPSTLTPSPTTAAGPTQLPRGGRVIFPRYRLVGYSGGGSKAFGRLGIGNIDARGREVEAHAKALAGGRIPLPVFELIAVIAHDKPGKNGMYNSVVDDAVIDRYLAAARRHRALLLLNVQPGRQDFLPLVKRLAPYLSQPDVGLALDPEWAVEPGQVPGSSYGRTTGAELDSVAAYLDALVRAKKLPQKAMVFHQVAAKVVQKQSAIRTRPGVVVIKSVDGIGGQGAKTDTWRVLVKGLPRSVHAGFKLFFVEDRRHGPLMTPRQILALRPQPEYVLYE